MNLSNLLGAEEMKKGLAKKYSTIIQVTIFMCCISSVCVAGVVEFTDEATFKNDTGNPQYFIDFESYGDGTSVPPGDVPINGDEWLNLGIQFAEIETGFSMILSAKPGMNVSPTNDPGHALAIAGLSPGNDRSSFLITFPTPVISFGVYIVDNETGGPGAYPMERIILKDEDGNIIGDFAMPGGAGPAPPLPIAHDFIGYSSTIPIAEVHLIEANDGEGALLDNVMYSVPEPPCGADLPILLFDDFDDGDYDGWSPTHTITGDPATAPDVVASPEGYSLRGIGSGYSPDPGLNVWLTYPLEITNASELKIEMRAKSGPQWPNSAWVVLVSGDDSYSFGDYGEGNQWAQFTPNVGGVSEWYNYSINANVWRDFAWTRDGDGWWSLCMDGILVWEDFCQDNRLTSFDRMGIHLLRNQSEIEWVRISAAEPPCGGPIEDSEIHEWIYCDPCSCATQGSLTNSDYAFDGDWNTYAEVRSNGNGTCSICCGLQETWSVPIGVDLGFHYKIESVDVYQQAIYIRFWNPSTSQWDDQQLYGHNMSPWDILDGVADETLPIPATYVDASGCFKSNIILLNKWNTNAWSRLYETSITGHLPCPVEVDIKPQSCPNPVNVESKGVLAVAVLGAEDFDVNTIDVASVRLEDVAPIRSNLEDVATRVSDEKDCDCNTTGPDGLVDLVLKFETEDIVEALGDVNEGDLLPLTLEGVLSDGGTMIEGTDCVVIRGRHRSLRGADINKDGVVDQRDFALFAERWLQRALPDE